MELSHLLEEPDIHAVYLDRLRAERLTRVLWELVHERRSWETMPLVPRDSGGGGGSDKRASPAFSRPLFVEFGVPPVRSLAFPGETWRLFKADYVAALNTLPYEQEDALKDHLLKKRYSAIFVTIAAHTMVRRSASADKALAEAVVTVLGVCTRVFVQKPLIQKSELDKLPK